MAFEILSITPNSGPTTGGNQVLVKGNGFETGAIVRIGNQNCSDIKVLESGSLISCVAPAALEGTYDVTVFNTLTNFKTAVGAYSYVIAASVGGVLQTPTTKPVQGVGAVIQTAPSLSVSSSGSPIVQVLGVPGNPPSLTADISRDTFNEKKNYDKLIHQQGVHVQDSELNEAQDITRGKFTDVVESAIGNGPAGDGFLVVENVGDSINKIKIKAGKFFYEGSIVLLHDDYVLSGLTTPVVDRQDIVYCVFCFEEVDSVDDPTIKDPVFNLETSRRVKIAVQIYVAEGALMSIPPDGCYAFPIALLHRHAGVGNVPQADIEDIRVDWNQNYCVHGINVAKTTGLSFAWTDGTVIVKNLFKNVSSGTSSVIAGSVTYLFVDETGTLQQNSGTPPAVVHVLKAKIVSDLTQIVSITDLCNYLPRVGLHDHNNPDYHINLQGGDIDLSELYHSTQQQWIDVFNGDGGPTNVADDWHKHGIRGLVIAELDDRYVNVTGDSMTGDLIMAPLNSAALLTGNVQETFDIVGALNDQIIISVDGSGPDAIFLTPGILITADTLASNLNTLFSNHIPQIDASVSVFSGRLVITSNSTGATSSLAISGSAATTIGFGVGNNSAVGTDAPAIRSNFVTFDQDGGAEIPRVGAFFKELDIPNHLRDFDSPAMDIVGAGTLGGPGRLVRIFDNLDVYGDLTIAGHLILENYPLKHNDLADIQGGIETGTDFDEHYHITQIQYELLTSPDGSSGIDIADSQHTHRIFDEIDWSMATDVLNVMPAYTKVETPHFEGRCIDLGLFKPTGGIVQGGALVIYGVGHNPDQNASPDRDIVLRDNVSVTGAIKWCNAATGHIGPLPDFSIANTGGLVYAYDAKPAFTGTGTEEDHFTFDGDSPIDDTEYEWDFSFDGVTFNVEDTGPSTTHDYAGDGGAGLRKVGLHVTNQHDHEAYHFREVNVASGGSGCQAAPVADYTFASGGGFSINFTSTSSAGSGCSITATQWDFSYDGVTFNIEGSGSTIAHNFGAAGNYQVAIKVTNNGGQTNIRVKTVPVGATAPVASFTINPNDTNFLMGETFTLTSTATPGSNPITVYEWDTNYDGFTFVVRRSGASMMDAFPSFVGNTQARTLAHRVKDAANISSNVATLAVVVYNTPQVQASPAFLGAVYRAAAGASFKRLEGSSGTNWCSGPWQITLINNIPPGFTTAVTAGPTVDGSGNGTVGNDRFTVVRDPGNPLLINIQIPNTTANNCKIDKLAPYSISVTISVTNGISRSRSTVLNIPIVAFTDITVNDGADPIDKTIVRAQHDAVPPRKTFTVTLTGKNLLLPAGDPSTDKVVIAISQAAQPNKLQIPDIPTTLLSRTDTQIQLKMGDTTGGGTSIQQMINLINMDCYDYDSDGVKEAGIQLCVVYGTECDSHNPPPFPAGVANPQTWVGTHTGITVIFWDPGCDAAHGIYHYPCNSGNCP